MTTSLTTAQRHKEKRFFNKFILIGLLGSVGLHLLAMATPTPGVWRQTEATEDELEVVIEDVETPPEVVQEPELSPEPEAVALADIAPPPIPLAPETTTPQPDGEDAPAPDDTQAMTSKTGDGDTTVQKGGGPIVSPGGTGDGYGFSKIPYGFNRLGQPDGSPQGQPGGVKDGKPGGVPSGTGEKIAAPSVPPPPAKNNPKLVCLKCPKPKYRGSEGQPKVTYDIGPDGRVTNVRLRKSSGNPDTDRETMETMTKWQFDPKTVPDGGRQDVKVRVTFEEKGSKFQQQNEQRRVEELKRRELAEQEQKRREALQPSSPPPIIPTPAAAQPSPPAAPTPAVPETPAPPVAAPVTTPAPAVENSAPAPVPVTESIPAAPPPPAPAPEPPPPAPVYEPPPAPEPPPAAPEPAPVESAPASP